MNIIFHDDGKGKRSTAVIRREALQVLISDRESRRVSYVDFFTDLRSAIDADILHTELLHLSSTNVLGSEEEEHTLIKAPSRSRQNSLMQAGVAEYFVNLCVKFLTRAQWMRG